jgi:hypothetical protein
MADPATTAAAYRQEAADKRRMAERLTDPAQRNRLLKEAQALDDLAQTLEEAAPG